MEAMEQEIQGFVLTDYTTKEIVSPVGRETMTRHMEKLTTVSPVDREIVAQHLEKLATGQQFRLEPLPPIPVEGKRLAAVNCVKNEGERFMLIALLKNLDSEGGTGYGRFNLSGSTALDILTRLVEDHQIPDFHKGGWEPVQVGWMDQAQSRRVHSKEAQVEELGGNKRGKK